MSRQRRIMYMIDTREGLVYSRVDSEVAMPVLDFKGMKSENNYEMNYNLEKFKVLDVASSLINSIGTRKIPTEIKNQHRKFWGMKPLSLPKQYHLQMNIGKAKYVVNHYNGIKTHKDGSPFYDIKIFKNKKKAYRKVLNCEK